MTVADDVVAARVDARAQGHRVEVLSARTETSQVFVNPNGTYTRVLAQAPVRVRDTSAKDGWRDIDLTLQRRADGLVAPASPYAPLHLTGGSRVSKDAPLVVLQSGKRSISLGWTGSLPAPVLDKDTATYHEVAAGIDLQVSATRTGFEQFFVIKKRPAKGATTPLTLPITTGGITITNATTGGQILEIAQHKPVGSIGRAITSDASSTGGVPTHTTVSHSSVQKVDGQESLVITPDDAFLQDPDTHYPVSIDPSVTLSGGSVTDAYIKSTTPDLTYGSTTQLAAGTYDSGATLWRSFLTFVTGTAMQGASISAATLGVWENNSYTCTASPLTAYGLVGRHYAVNQTWNNQPAIDPNLATTVTTAKGFSSSCAADWVNVDVKPQLQASLNSGYEVLTVELRASETANSGWKVFDSAEGTHVPALSVTYNSSPAKPTIPAVSAGTTGAAKVYTSSLSPSFTATSADPEADKVQITTEVYNSPTTLDATTFVSSCTTGLVTSGTAATCTPAGTLTDGTQYWARSKAVDATAARSGWSKLLYFATAAAAPPAPTVSCPSPYTDGYWADTAPGAAVSCTVTATGGSKGLAPKQIQVTLDGGDPTTTAVASSGTTTATLSVPAASGVHTITATTTNAAQVTSSTATYRFGYGAPGLATPNDGAKTIGPVKINAYAPFRGTASQVSASLQWRVSGTTGSDSGWNTASTADVTPPDATTSPNYKTTWDSTTATSDNSTTPPTTLNPRLNTLLDVRVCFTYDTGAPQCTTGSRTTTILRVPSAFGGGFPVAAAGEGQVALTTGEFTETVTDVDRATNSGSLTIARTHSTFTTSSTAATGVFGPGWTADFGGDSGAAGLAVTDRTSIDGSLTFTSGDGSGLVYQTPTGAAGSSPTGTYVPVDDATRQANAAVTVAVSGTTKRLTMTDLDGTVTTWQLTGTADWAPVSVAQAGQQGTTTYTTDSLGRITRVLAPVPDGITCPATGTLGAGCSWLRITYASSTTATSTTPGDYAGQVKSVYFNNYDPASSGMTEVKLAGYTYDTSGRLAVHTDALNSLTDSYQYATYNGFTALTQTAATGYAPYTYSYMTTGGNVRLSGVSRGAAVAGGSDAVLSSYVYDAAPGSDGPDLSATRIAKWGQTRVPTTAYAVFGLDHPVTGTPTAADWPFASLYYTDSVGYTVNTAQYGAGQWLLTATDYDATGAVTTSLDATDIDTAVTDSTANIPFDPKANSTITRYLPAVPGSNPDAPLVAADSVVQDTWSAPFTAVLQDGTTAQVRTHTHYTYDAGAPNNGTNADTGAPYLLPTTTTVGVSSVSDTSTDPTATLPDDIEINSVVKDEYDPIDGASTTGPTSGWTLGQPTVVTAVMPDPNDSIVHKTRYDAAGNTVATSDPGSSGTDAGTTLTMTYTAGSNSQDAACGNHPEWAGVTCWTGPAAEPTSGTDIPDIRTTSYNRWLEPLTLVETSGSGTTQATRTTTLTYYGDGRQKTTSVGTSGLTGSTAVPKTQATYTGTALIPSGTQALNADGTVNTQDVASFDLWGRVTKYYNSTADNSNYTYIAPGSPGAGSIATIATPKGSSTYSYDGTDANSNTEHRGLPTTLTVTGVGTFAGGYDRNGNLTTQTMPAGITQKITYDSQNRPVALQYTGDVTSNGTTTTGTWLAYGRNYDTAGRVAADWSPSGASTQPGGYTRGYTYNRASRLTQVSDSSGSANTGTLSCTTRTYQFDVRGNRTSLAAATGPDCTTTGGTTTTWAYDSNSRQTTGANGSGTYSYDQLGRQTTIPAADAPNNAGQSLALGYFDTDAVSSIGQGTTTTTFTLDPDGRNSTSTTGSTTTTNHYVNSSDNPTWVTQTTGSTTTTSRYVNGLSGTLTASTTTSATSTASLTLTDLSGSVVASITIPATGNASTMSAYSGQDEYGNDAQAASLTGVNKYGWLGGAQRAVQSSGLYVMGARLYSPTTARFTTRDPIAGGNENPYNYPDDPINLADLSGLAHDYKDVYEIGKTAMHVWDILKRIRSNFGRVFPPLEWNPGARLKSVGQTLLTKFNDLGWKGVFEGHVKVTSLDDSGWVFRALKDHPDHDGTISFHFSHPRSGILSLTVRGHIPHPLPGNVSGKLYDFLFQTYWGIFAQNVAYLLNIRRRPPIGVQ